MKLAKIAHRNNGFAYQGMYVKIFIENFPIEKLKKDKPLIISTLLKNERKMTIVSMSIQR